MVNIEIKKMVLVMLHLRRRGGWGPLASQPLIYHVGREPDTALARTDARGHKVVLLIPNKCGAR
jgi:hypothetical protein